jgi:hypothetical protein
VIEGRALSVLLEVEVCGHTGKVPGGVWEGGRTRDDILTRAVKGVKGRNQAFGNEPGLGSGYGFGAAPGFVG